MVRELFLDVRHNRCRAAVVEDGRLSEIHIEKQSQSNSCESLYYGRVQSIRASLHAAFVDIGEEKNAFLPLEESVGIKCGDMLIVQAAARQENDDKGLRITTKINLAGRWTVIVPGETGVHISKKVKDPSVRTELLRIAERIRPEGCGIIIRTASADITEELLEEEAASLYERWMLAKKRAVGMIKPGMLLRSETLSERLIRDLRDIFKVTTNSVYEYARLAEMQKHALIDNLTVIELYAEKNTLLFDAFNIESQIDKALKKRVWLPCGGYLVIDLCEALTVIDVNSGKMTLGSELEETALKVNLEAAEEIARQIRLRDLGGIIIVDFIDLMKRDNRQLLIRHMKEAVLRDRTPVVIEGMTRLGLMEITRKRVRNSLHKHMQSSCSYCSGRGEVICAEEIACRALRQVKRMTLSGQRGPFVIRCSPQVAQALTGMHTEMEETSVYALSVNGKHAERFDIEQTGAGSTIPKEAVKLS